MMLSRFPVCFICIICSGILFFSTIACGKKAPPPNPPPPPGVTAAQPIRKSVTDYLELTGDTQAINTVQLVARVSGYLQKVLFQDGQFVKNGQLLFVIQQDTYQEALQQAEASIRQQQASLAYAEAQLKRYAHLVKTEAVSESDVDNWRFQRDTAQANLKSAEAQKALALLNLSYTEVRAPFDGRIDRRLVDPGNLVGSGQNTVIALINQINPIYVYFNIGDEDLARLMGQTHWMPGQATAERRPVFLGVLGETGYPHRGHLDFASISLTATSGTLLLRGIFPNKSGKILPGLYARVRVPVEKKSALLVPDTAISNDQQGSYVLIINDKNVVERRNVQTGSMHDDLRVVEQGLNGNERVIVKGLLRAIPGRTVAPEREAGQPARMPQPKR